MIDALPVIVFGLSITLASCLMIFAAKRFLK